MAKYNYLPVSSIVEDWLDFSGEDQHQLDETIIKKWANDAVERITTGEQLIHRIDLLRVRDYKTTLPEGFRYLHQAAYKLPDNTPFSKLKGNIVKGTRALLGNSANVSTAPNNCKTCGQDWCTCSSNVLSIEIENIYDQASYDLYEKYMNHFQKRGSIIQENTSRHACTYNPQFILMSKSSSDFSNIPFHLNNCPNINLDHEVEYNITNSRDGNLLLTCNIRNCDVLVSYLGTQVDEQGYRMIPNVEVVFKAINLYIEERLAYRQYRKSRAQKDAMFYERLVPMTERAISRAKSQIAMPDPDEWKQWVRNNWLKLIPGWDSQKRFGQRTNDRFRYPDQTRGNFRDDAPSFKYRGQ